MNARNRTDRLLAMQAQALATDIDDLNLDALILVRDKLVVEDKLPHRAINRDTLHRLQAALDSNLMRTMGQLPKAVLVEVFFPSASRLRVVNGTTDSLTPLHVHLLNRG